MIPETSTQELSTELIKKPNTTFVFWGLSSFQILAMFRRGLFYTFLSIYMREFLQLSVTATTLYATFPMVLSSFCQMFVWGRISDKLQKRRTLIIIGEIIAGILLIVTYELHAQVATRSLRNAGFVIIGGLSVIEIFWSMSNIGWSAFISDLYPSKERSRVMSQLTGIGGAGRIVGIFLGGALYEGLFRFEYEGWGFREGWLFYIASFVMFLSTIPLFFMPEGGIKSQKIETMEMIPEVNSALNETMDIDSTNYKHILKIFIIFIIALVFINFGRNSVAVIYSQFIRLDGLIPQEIDSRMLSYIANMRSFATIVIGIFAAKISKKIGNGLTLMIATIIAISYLLITAISSSLSMLFIASFLSGSSEVIIGAASYAYAAELIPEEKRAKIFGIYNATFFLSWGLASTIITGPLVDALINKGNSEIFSYRMGFVVAISLTAIGFIILIILEFLRRRNSK